MDAVIDPSILFISDDDWYDTEKQDEFLDLLLCTLENIDKYNICNIYWTDPLQADLCGEPHKHPWYASDVRNPLVSIISQKFYSRLEVIDEHETPTKLIPELKDTSPNSLTNERFLKMVHFLTYLEMPFLFAIGKKNILSNDENYITDCNCCTAYSPPTIKNSDEWLQFVDTEDFYPTSITDFEKDIKIAFDMIIKRDFNDKEILYEYGFSPTFKRDLLGVTNHKKNILERLTKKLVLTYQEATSDSQLRDEYIKQNKEFRFRVTGRPYSTRIHYNFNISNNTIEFLKYYDEGEHDDGL